MNVKECKTPIMVTMSWLVVLLLLTHLLGGCQTESETKPSVFDTLTTAESTITAGANTLKRALELGTITTADSDYAKVYDALQQAGQAMDRAWAAYRAGQLVEADASKRFAMESYMAVRPILVNLAEGQ